MRIDSIELENVFSYKKELVRLPSRGVVLVTGENGHGKSALLDAVSFAIHGRTLRKTSPFASKPARVSVVANGIAFERALKGRSTSFSFSDPDDLVSVTYDTSEDAQRAAEDRFGSWEHWARSHVFSTQEGVTFNSAKDAEQKNLLERIFGIGRFDLAAVEARRDHKTAVDSLALARQKHLHAHGTHAAALQSYERARLRYLEGKKALADVTGDDLDALRATAARTAEARIASSRLGMQAQSDTAERIASRAAVAAVVARLAAIDEQLRTHRNAANAPTACNACKRPFDNVEDAIAHAREALEKLTQDRAAVSAELQTAVDADAAVKNAEHRKAQEANEAMFLAASEDKDAARALASAEARASEAQRLAARVAKDRSEAEGLRAQAITLGEAVGVAQTAADRADLEARTMGEVVDVLGPRGVRSAVLGRGLAGLEAAATTWLSRVGGDITGLSIAPGTRGDGRPDGSIDITIAGIAGPLGAPATWKSASNGQRRRIDVALLLALADASGDTTGTLWFDEVFDGLDDKGLAGLGGALNALASRRCVVVIAHNSAVADAVSPVQRWHVNRGKVAIRLHFPDDERGDRSTYRRSTRRGGHMGRAVRKAPRPCRSRALGEDRVSARSAKERALLPERAEVDVRRHRASVRPRASHSAQDPRYRVHRDTRHARDY